MPLAFCFLWKTEEANLKHSIKNHRATYMWHEGAQSLVAAADSAALENVYKVGGEERGVERERDGGELVRSPGSLVLGLW